MITVFGEGRGFRVVWLLEEMGLVYRLRPVDLLAGVENDPEFLAINPGGFIPAIQDGDVTMVESIAIMEYLIARYGDESKSKAPLAPAPHDPAFAAYQQFLHLGEAGLGGTIQLVVVSRNFAPETERENWGARWSLEQFENRRKLVDAPTRARALYGGRRVHRRRHFRDICFDAGEQGRRRRPRRSRAGLHGPHHHTRCLQAGAGNVSGDEGLARQGGGAVTVPA